MSAPHLFTSPVEIEGIKKNLEIYPWYKNAFARIKDMCDEMVRKGFSVPKLKGYVFNETCRAHNIPLRFDPYDPSSFECSVCGINYQDEPYKRAWITQYHSWLSQMSVYLGIAYIVTEEEKYAVTVRDMLRDYVKYFPSYPNNDNEIGTTKVFQSTFMDSVWLTYFACGYDMVNDCKCFTESDRKAIVDMFKDSADVIRDYDERWNNRQAFNNTAMCAVALLRDDKEMLDHALYGEHGFTAHMKYSVLEDGLWYEGDNYHFATVPSMVNIAEMCLHNGIDFYSMSFEGHTIKDMFDGPLKSLQPDFTFPSRKDSPYANMLAQRWYCGLYEVAYTRYKDKALGRMLNLAYSDEVKNRSSLASAAGIMDMFKPAFATRSELDWRSFLNVTPDLGSERGLPVNGSINMTGTGLAVLRRNGNYINLDYGYFGGGHGHPDRLNITCFLNGRRWFTDYGTGNYYLDHLRYYRSTLGHNTVNEDGQQHMTVDGDYDIFENCGSFDIARATVRNLYVGTDVTRTVILFDEGIIFDSTQVQAKKQHRYHSVLHGFGELHINVDDAKEAKLKGAAYDFLHDIKGGPVRGSHVCRFDKDEASLCVYTATQYEENMYEAKAYGPPKFIPKLFPILIQEKEGKENENGYACSFTGIYEDVPKGNNSIVKSFRSVKDGIYEIEFVNSDRTQIMIDKNSVTVAETKNNNTIIKKASQRPRTPLAVKDPVVFAKWIDYQTTEGKPVCVSAKNISDKQTDTELFKEPLTLAPYEERISRVKLDNECISYEDTVLKVKYNKDRDEFTKKCLFIPYYERQIPMTKMPWNANIVMDSPSQIARAERHWTGKDDLSLEGMIFVSSGSSISMMLHVNDNHVLFSGGKYDCDNDSVQIYFDRRDEGYKDVELFTDGVYGLFVKAGVNGNISRIEPITDCIKDIKEISVTVYMTEKGYDICLDIPFHCLGGAPVKGDVWGFDIILNDRDSGVRRDLMMYWSGAYKNERTYMCDTLHDPKRFGMLCF
ncbi:MAG: heparinase II/III family protein [Clostridia bacterium]